MRWRRIAAAISLCLASAAWAQEDAGSAADHYYQFLAEPTTQAHPWIVILPGGGGISVFEDHHFYFDLARRWNELGFDVIVVHYQAAAPLLDGMRSGRVGEREALVVADALAVAGTNGWIDRACPGIAIGYSLGGEGSLTLASAENSGLAGAIAWYPSVRGQARGFRSAMPLLILQGEADRVTPVRRLNRFVERAADSSALRVEIYPDAIHGFDIPSLVTARELRGAQFQFHPAAAEAATIQAEAFATTLIAQDPRTRACGAQAD